MDPGPIRLDNVHHNIVAPGDRHLGRLRAAPQQWHDNIYVGTEGLFGWDYEPFEVWQAPAATWGRWWSTSLEGGIGDPDNPIDGPDLPGICPTCLTAGFDPDLPNFNPDWDPILDRPEPPPEEPGVPLNVLVLQLSADIAGDEPAFIVSVDGEEVGEGSVEVKHGEGTDRVRVPWRLGARRARGGHPVHQRQPVAATYGRRTCSSAARPTAARTARMLTWASYPAIG